MTELEELRRRVEHLEDCLIAAAGASDPLMDVRRLRIDCARKRPELERTVRERLVARTNRRTERSPRFDGMNHAALRQWAAGRCSLPDELGSLRLIWHGEDQGLVHPGDWLVADPDTGRMTIGRPAAEYDTTDDLADIYEEASQ